MFKFLVLSVFILMAHNIPALPDGLGYNHQMVVTRCVHVEASGASEIYEIHNADVQCGSYTGAAGGGKPPHIHHSAGSSPEWIPPQAFPTDPECQINRVLVRID